LKLNYFEPFNSYIELEKMKLNPEGEVIIRKLSDMVDMFQDKEAVMFRYRKKRGIYSTALV